MTRRWCLLIHNVPPRPLYLRAKVRQRLTRVGAVALKNSVYVLPWSEDALEDFQWVAEEILAGGGQAWITAGELLAGVRPADLMARFREERDADFKVLAESVREALDALKERSGSQPPESHLPATISKLRQRFKDIRDIDFFGAPAGKEVEQMLQRLEKKLRPRPTGKKGAGPAKIRASSWVTRRGIKVDRISSAWLVRRFIDPEARFRFVDPEHWEKRKDEIAFDMSGGDYSHEGDRCTFETILTRFHIKDPALRPIAQIIHDIDVKDGKYGRPDTPGIQQLIEGILAADRTDEERLERGFALLDDLYRSFAPKGKRG